MQISKTAKGGRFKIPVNLPILSEVSIKMEKFIQDMSEYYSVGKNGEKDPIVKTPPQHLFHLPSYHKRMKSMGKTNPANNYAKAPAEFGHYAYTIASYDLLPVIQYIVSQFPNMKQEMIDKIIKKSDTVIDFYIKFCQPQHSQATAAMVRDNEKTKHVTEIIFLVQPSQPLNDPRYAYHNIFLSLHHEFQHIIEAQLARATNHWPTHTSPSNSERLNYADINIPLITRLTNYLEHTQSYTDYISHPHEARAFASAWATQQIIQDITLTRTQIQEILASNQTDNAKKIAVMQLSRTLASPSSEKLQTIAKQLRQKYSNTEYKMQNLNTLSNKPELTEEQKAHAKEVILTSIKTFDQVIAATLANYQNMAKQYGPQLYASIYPQQKKQGNQKTLTLPTNLQQMSKLLNDENILANYGDPDDMRRIIAIRILMRFPIQKHNDVKQMLYKMCPDLINLLGDDDGKYGYPMTDTAKVAQTMKR